MPKTQYCPDETCPNSKLGHHVSLRGSTPLESSINDESSSGSTEGTPITASMSIDTTSTANPVGKRNDSMHTRAKCPSQFSNHRPLPLRMSHFGGSQYHGAWETLSRHYHPNQHEYNKVISSLTHGKKPKRKNIFQLGRSNKSNSSSRKSIGGLGSSSSRENTSISNPYKSLLLSSTYANIRKEPRPSSAHGHFGGSGRHHGAGKIRRGTDSGTESGGSSGSSTREFGGGGRARTDSEAEGVIISLTKL